MPDPDHQDIDWGFPEIPLRPVKKDFAWELLRQKSDQKAAKGCKPDLVVGEKTADSPVVRVFLDTGLQGDGDLPEIRRYKLRQGRGKASHKLQPRTVGRDDRRKRQ